MDSQIPQTPSFDHDRPTTPSAGATANSATPTTVSSPKVSKKNSKKIFPWLLGIAALACVIFYLTNSFTMKPAADTSSTDATHGSTAPAYPMAYITASYSLNLREGPSTSYDVITTIPTGNAVYVLEVQGNWAYISFEDLNGWCTTKYLSFADQ